MATSAEIEEWRKASGCVRCVHYHGCKFFMALALMAQEDSVFRSIMLPSLTEKCPMFFGWRDREDGHREE